MQTLRLSLTMAACRGSSITMPLNACRARAQKWA